MSIKANTQIDVIDLELSRNEIREPKKTVNSIIISNLIVYFIIFTICYQGKIYD